MVAATVMYAVKIAQPSKKTPRALPTSLALTPANALRCVLSHQYETQKAPNEQNAVAPNVLPLANSQMPAVNWPMPP